MNFESWHVSDMISELELNNNKKKTNNFSAGDGKQAIFSLR